VTDSPASLLVCIDAAGRSARALAANGVFCVNTLAVSDRALAEAFAGHSGLSGEARFSAGRWGSLATGAPALETSLVAFDCRLVEARLVATHYVVIGAVVESASAPRRPRSPTGSGGTTGCRRYPGPSQAPHPEVRAEGHPPKPSS
jgi:flavin reductase